MGTPHDIPVDHIVSSAAPGLFPDETTALSAHPQEPASLFTNAVEQDQLPSIRMYSGLDAAKNPQLVGLISQLFNESFGFRPDGKPYRLGPKSMAERLQQTDYLFVAGDERFGVGYLFGKEAPSSQGRIAWIESMAVLPLYRRRGIATELVTHFARITKGAKRFGCATPNPIATLIVSRVVPGKLYIGRCGPPYHLRKLLHEIREHCFDLRGCLIDEWNFTIKTGFSPLSRSDQREWNPKATQTMPPWWTWVEHLPNEYEALLIIERESH